MATSSGVHRVKHIIDRYLLVPAYTGLIASMVLRGMIAAASTFFDYNRVVPLVIRASIEIGMIAGVIASGEIITSSAAASLGEIRRSLADVAAMRLRGNRADQELQRSRMAAALRDERSGYIFAAMFASGLSVAYGIVFESQALAAITWQSIIIAAIGLIAPPFGVYQFSANYKPPTEDPGAAAEAASRQAGHRLIADAQTAIASGNYSNAHVEVIRRGLRRDEDQMLAALLKHEDVGRIYSTAEIYQMLHITDDARRRQVLRRLARALADNAPGVAREARTGWQVSSSAMFDLFGEMLLADSGRTPADNVRTRKPRQLALVLADSGQLADNRQTADSPLPELRRIDMSASANLPSA